MHRDHTRNPLLSRNPSPRLMRHPDGSSSAVRRGATDRRPCHLLRCHSLDREGGSRGWFQRFPEAWGNGIRHPGCMSLARVVPEVSRNMGQRHPPSGVLEPAAGASDSHNGEKPDVLERPRTETDVVEPWIAVDGRRRADLSLGGSGSSPVSVEVACPGQAGALKGKAGGKAQRGNMSASSRARSRMRWAPARKASTKAR
jgi:hypothetical protein